jgi:hypothetical protein
MSEVFVPTHRDFKGALVRVLHQATDIESSAPRVIYQDEDGRVWSCASAHFHDLLPDGQPRFAAVPPKDNDDIAADPDSVNGLLRSVDAFQQMIDRGAVALPGAQAAREWASLVLEVRAAVAELRAVKRDRDAKSDMFRYADLKLDLALDDVRALKGEVASLKKDAAKAQRWRAALEAVAKCVESVEYMLKYNEWFNSDQWELCNQDWVDTKRKVEAALAA